MKRSRNGPVAADAAGSAASDGRLAPTHAALLPQAAPRPGSDIGEVPFAIILDHAKVRLRRELDGGDPRERLRVKTRLLIIERLRPYWTGHCGRDGPAEEAGYKKALSQTEIRWGRTDKDGNRRTYSPSTAVADLLSLNAFTNWYRDDFGLNGRVKFAKRKIATGSDDWYERDDIACMLWVVRGRVWDPDCEAWKVDASGRRILLDCHRFDAGWRRRWDGERWKVSEVDEETAPKGQRLNCHAWIARLIISGVYSGSTNVLLRNLGWEGVPAGDSSYVDLDTEIEGRVGYLYRLGIDRAPGPMAGVPVALTRRLKGHMGRWRVLDREEGFSHVLHGSADDNRNHMPPSAPFGETVSYVNRVFAKGGIDPLDYKKLTNTTAVWIIRAGTRGKFAKKIPIFKRNPAILRSGAFMISQRYESFLVKYKSIDLKFMYKALKALKSLPGTVRS